MQKRAQEAIESVPRDLYYGGEWHAPAGGYRETWDPGTGRSLGPVGEADASDIDAAVSAAEAGFREWRKTTPAKRSSALRAFAAVLRANGEELALLDAVNCGNPYTALLGDIEKTAAMIEFFAGLTTEAKGSSIPAGNNLACFTIREPYGVCARIVAYNHPLMFSAGKIAAPVAAGNSVIIKPPHQSPLSALRMAELAHDVFPPGVVNVITGIGAAGPALVGHDRVPLVTLIGSIETGRAVYQSCAAKMKRVLLELSGKNALIAYADADVPRVVDGIIKGMNFEWCGQSCGSTSRVFLHHEIHDEVVAQVKERIATFRPGIPSDPATNMGAVISKAHQAKIVEYIESAVREGAELAHGGKVPQSPDLAGGFFVEPTLFTGVTPTMKIAQEEIFGPVLAIIKWDGDEGLLEQLNDSDYGLTCSIYTSDLNTAWRTASSVEAGFVWVNDTASHYVGAPFGGYKSSGLGREESIEELLEFTQIKTIKFAI